MAGRLVLGKEQARFICEHRVVMLDSGGQLVEVFHQRLVWRSKAKKKILGLYLCTRQCKFSLYGVAAKLSIVCNGAAVGRRKRFAGCVMTVAI